MFSQLKHTFQYLNKVAEAVVDFDKRFVVFRRSVDKKKTKRHKRGLEYRKLPRERSREQSFLTSKHRVLMPVLMLMLTFVFTWHISF